MTIYLAPDGKEYPSIFEPYHASSCSVVWICLKTGDRTWRHYDLSVLKEVKSQRHTAQAVDMEMVFTVAMAPHMTEYLYTVPLAPNMTEYLYTCEPPPRILEVFMPPKMLVVNDNSGVRFITRIAA